MFRKTLFLVVACVSISGASSVINPGSSGSGTTTLPLPPGDTNYIQVSTGPTTQPAAFHVSSGTVSGPLYVSTITTSGLGSIFSDNGTTTDTPLGPVDVYKSNAAGAGGDVLFSVGSNQQNNQFVVQDQRALSLVRYGINAGQLLIGNVSPNQHIIYDAQSVQNQINWWNNGEMVLQTASVANGGTDIKFVPGAGSFNVVLSTSGHVLTSGTAPNMGTCGVSPSVVGDDNQGIITIGSGVSVTACTMNFASSWGTGCNVTCQESDNSTAATGDVSAIGPTSVTFSFSVSLGGGLIYYHCGGSGTTCR